MLKKFIAASAFGAALAHAPALFAQPANDPLATLNACLAAPASSEPDFMKRLNPALNAPDRVAWCLFIYVNSAASTPGNNNALFETWASDADTFQANPIWPSSVAAAKPLRQPILPHLAKQAQRGLSRGEPLPTTFVLPFSSTQCTPGTLCIGEEVRRNKATFDFIKDNGLYSQQGLLAFQQAIQFPADSIEVKANWVPVNQLGQFLAGSGSPVDAGLYHLNSTTENGQQVQYALVSLHVISKMVPNWTWATFEHMNNPGRCDFLGCYDTFGADPASVLPMKNASGGIEVGKQYPNCNKTGALAAQFAAGNIHSVFQNYCLKGTQLDFTDPQGVVTRLGNTVTEQGFLDTASCISCHGRASYTSVGGAFSANRVFMYNTSPIGPLGPPEPAQFWLFPEYDPTRSRGAPIFRATDFVWSIPFCAVDANGKSRCSDK